MTFEILKKNKNKWDLVRKSTKQETAVAVAKRMARKDDATYKVVKNLLNGNQKTIMDPFKGSDVPKVTGRPPSAESDKLIDMIVGVTFAEKERIRKRAAKLELRMSVYVRRRLLEGFDVDYDL